MWPKMNLIRLKAKSYNIRLRKGCIFVDSLMSVIQNMRLPVFGGVPEWSKGADCKSAASASEVQSW